MEHVLKIEVKRDMHERWWLISQADRNTCTDYKKKNPDSFQECYDMQKLKKINKKGMASTVSPKT